MQFVALNVAKVELDSTSATVARNVSRKCCTVCSGLNGTLNVLMFDVFEGRLAFPGCTVSLDVRSSLSEGGLM